MNNFTYNLRELYLKDTDSIIPLLSKYKYNSIFNAYGEVRSNMTRNILATFKANPGYKIYVWEAVESNSIKALALLFCSTSLLNFGKAQIELVFNQDFTDEEISYEQLLNSIIDEFNKFPMVQILEFQLSDENNNFSNIFIKHKFSISKENILNSDNFFINNGYIKIYSINKLYDWPYTWVFIPTEVAIFAVYGGKNKIIETKWLKYNSYINDIYTRSLCIIDGICDSNGIVKNKSYLSNLIPDNNIRYIPDILIKSKIEVLEYFRGERSVFNLPLSFEKSSVFQKEVLKAVSTIRMGNTVTYEDIAEIVSMDKDYIENASNFSRAIGQSLANNPLCVLIPCHRIIAKDGKLQGYKYGLEIKDWLLAKEILFWS